MEFRNIHFDIVKKMPKKVGQIFFINRKAYRRGVGILYTGRYGMDPTLNRGFWKREKRRQKRVQKNFGS